MQKMETEVAETTNTFDAKFLFRKTIWINVPLFLYSITCFMFHTIFQALTYHKVCLQYGDQIVGGVNCSNPNSSNKELLAIATWIRLLSNVAFCSIGFLTSALIGRLGDTKSRRLALLIPFSGLVLEGITLVVQSHYMELSVYWLIGSEALFAAFGGYMSIFSSFFGYATDSVCNYSPKCRSLIIAVLEGVIGLGGTIGYPGSILLKHCGFSNLFTALLVIYIICFVAVFFLPSINNNKKTEYKKDLFGLDLFVRNLKLEMLMKPAFVKFVERWVEKNELVICSAHEGCCDATGYIACKCLRQQQRMGIFIAVIAAFTVSFFTFIGSTLISFYYLKLQFGWDAGKYGLLKGPAMGLSTFSILFAYPLLRTYNFTDRTLSLIGVISRALGVLWLAVTWSSTSTFLLIYIDSFSRFAASGMRAMLANIVPVKNHGSMFTFFGVAEAFSNLMAGIIIHKVFQLSLHFLPQLSFYILAIVMLIPIVILCLLPEKLANTEEQ